MCIDILYIVSEHKRRETTLQPFYKTTMSKGKTNAVKMKNKLKSLRKELLS